MVRLEPVSRTKVAGSPSTWTLSRIKPNRLLSSRGTIVALRGRAEGSCAAAERGISRRRAQEILQSARIPQPPLLVGLLICQLVLRHLVAQPSQLSAHCR